MTDKYVLLYIDTGLINQRWKIVEFFIGFDSYILTVGPLFMKMNKGDICPPGAEIETPDECNEALQLAAVLDITLNARKHLVSGAYSDQLGVPHQCSYQAGGDQAFHFNNLLTVDNPGFVNGGYHMICKNGRLFWIALKVARTMTNIVILIEVWIMVIEFLKILPFLTVFTCPSFLRLPKNIETDISLNDSTIVFAGANIT